MLSSARLDWLSLTFCRPHESVDVVLGFCDRFTVGLVDGSLLHDRPTENCTILG